jgi:hypothetical protein
MLLLLLGLAVGVVGTALLAHYKPDLFAKVEKVVGDAADKATN